MALFPTPRTPVPKQRHVIVYTFGLLAFAILLILCIYGRSRNEDDTGPVRENYYIKVQRDESWLEKLVGDPVALFTLVLSGFTGGLYLATRSLFVATEKLVTGADKSSERQLRAYVLPDIVELRGFASPVPTSTIVIKNYGQTPAYNVQIGVWCGIMKTPVENKPENPARTPSDGGSFVGPSGSVHLVIPADKPIDDTQRAALLNGEVALFLTGVIYYRDAFKKERETRFCFYRVPPGRPGFVYADGPMSTYEEWNYAD